MAGRFFHLLALFHAVCFVVRTTHCSAFAKPSSVVRLDDGNRLARKLQGLVDGRVVTQQGSPDSFDEACKGWMAAGYSQDYHSRPALVLQPAGTRTLSYTRNPNLLEVTRCFVFLLQHMHANQCARWIGQNK